jgi:hypothetical protein
MSRPGLFSSTFVSSSSRARKLQDPLIFHEDYGPVADWYRMHRNNGSTTIRKMQLRKEHAAPAHHEYIVVVTRAGHTYRVDRGRDGPVLDTVREEGVPPRDTIALLHLPSLTQLDGTSYCMIELRWGHEKTIDLTHILDICFQIHNKSGKRYKLLTHNCYFFAQTIIMIAVRKSVTFRAGLDKALKRGTSGITWKGCWEVTVGVQGVQGVRSDTSLGVAVGAALGRELGRQLRQEMEKQLGPELGKQLGRHLGRELGHQLGQELERELGQELGQELKWEQKQQQKREVERDRAEEREQERERKWELERQQRSRQYQGLQRIGCFNWWWAMQKWKQLREWERMREPKRMRVREWKREQRQKREVERERRRRRRRQEQRERLWEQLQEGLKKLEPNLELELELARRALAVVMELALNGELEPGWHRKCGLHNLTEKSAANKPTSIWYVKQQTLGHVATISF